MEHIDEYEARQKKRDDLLAHGIEPYPVSINRTHTCRDAQDDFDHFETDGQTLVLAGRVRSIRRHGGSTFVVIEDGTNTFQLFIRKDSVEDSYDILVNSVDLGDILEARGTLMRTRTGEKTLAVVWFQILSKALLPLPEQWHGLSDVEMRYRHRELDLIANPSVKERFIIRSRLVSGLRRFLDESGFIEVETPILQAIPGGANARPFVTHHNALDCDLYLRIAPELFLKRLIIGGFEKVYEVGRLFRNEGIDHAHNPEFTSIELYWAYVPTRDAFINFLEELVRTTVMYAIGTLAVKSDDAEIDFSKKWKQLTFRQAVIEFADIDIDDFRSEEALVAEVRRKKIPISFDNCVGLGEHYDQLFKKTAREAIVEPTWIFDYPIELKPLAKASPDDPTKSASAQLIVRGSEIINAYYHELNDPVDQRNRFMEQESLRERGSAEAQFLDEDYLFALEHGLPPTSGMGMGIDRLVMMLTGQSQVKEVILFPTLRPKKRE